MYTRGVIEPPCFLGEQREYVSTLIKWAQQINTNSLHEYYTPKDTKFQGVLYIFTIFVDYADFYVNMVMSTKVTLPTGIFIIFADYSTYGVSVCGASTKC